MDFLKYLYLHLYHIKMVACEPTLMPPFEGSTIRGALGWAIRETACLTGDLNQDCTSCPKRARCVYNYLFSPTLSKEELQSLGLHQMPSPPFILEPPFAGGIQYKAGDFLSFGIVLVGKANDFLPFIVNSLSKMGQKGIGRSRSFFLLESVDAIFPEGLAVRIYNQREKKLRPTNNRVDIRQMLGKSAGSALRLSLLTPLRLQATGSRPGSKHLITQAPPFNFLLQRLYERARMLSILYCDGPSSEDKALLNSWLERFSKVQIQESDLYWYDWSRYSSKQDELMKFGGLLGWIIYRGEIREALPLLRFGQYMHVGKAASFGLGGYKVEQGL